MVLIVLKQWSLNFVCCFLAAFCENAPHTLQDEDSSVMRDLTKFRRLKGSIVAQSAFLIFLD